MEKLEIRYKEKIKEMKKILFTLDLTDYNKRLFNQTKISKVYKLLEELEAMVRNEQ